MPPRDAFLLRIDPKVLAALRRWADDDMRSVNAQVEYLLRRCLQEQGRWKPLAGEPAAPPPKRGRPPKE
ncbi:MAG: hypothetical protein EXS06_05700 [Planctomycetaceae bacterium]|nr:hypothetical protein [Planctomycetaceae bacterium]